MKNLNYLLTFTLLSGLLLFSSCEKEEEPEMNPIQSESSSIAEIASSDENFSILVEALAKTDLVSTLSEAGNYTVFAPDNHAFNELFVTLGVSGIQDIPAEDLKPILLYHVLGETMTSTMINDGYYSSLSPSQGRTVSMYIGTGNGVSINGSANVTIADIMASNGVIHAINTVILPPTVVDLAVQNGSFQTLVSAVIGAGLSETLSNASGTFTVFAPTDDAFSVLGDNVPSDLTPILLYHVLGSAVYSDEILSGSVSSLNASDPEILVEISDKGVILNGSANVVATDIVGTNGVIHVIDKVLLP